MHPVIRAAGKILRLVGISSPEDYEAKKESGDGPPSWRREAAKKAEAHEANEQAKKE